MSSRVLTPDVVGIDALVHDHQTVLAKAEGGVVAAVSYTHLTLPTKA